jgi:hypothetical protein
VLIHGSRAGKPGAAMWSTGGRMPAMVELAIFAAARAAGHLGSLGQLA